MRSAIPEAAWKEGRAGSWSTSTLIVMLEHLESWSGVWTVRESLLRTLRRKDNFTGKIDQFYLLQAKIYKRISTNFVVGSQKSSCTKIIFVNENRFQTPSVYYA